MAKKDNLNNNDPISKAVDLLLENTEDCYLALFTRPLI
ncbi:hypothetical protein [Spiroplasma endosymbiont of Danaus chrysippus]|nr:hypothetical protein [Spiroplasma endosymbiont of Danaus chrysippus]